ncbi:hypothetical protein GE061_012724 [Apolygus lucorum]|uniref:Uncharacterized protein n=1 Tax=Apolygus lucorum TaxID=248454 RepID=A0A8S9XTD3_APOLU|nr:hypothetical protein GE061_012724 [Apolygus lucorum]
MSSQQLHTDLRLTPSPPPPPLPPRPQTSTGSVLLPTMRKPTRPIPPGGRRNPESSAAAKENATKPLPLPPRHVMSIGTAVDPPRPPLPSISFLIPAFSQTCTDCCLHGLHKPPTNSVATQSSSTEPPKVPSPTMPPPQPSVKSAIVTKYFNSEKRWLQTETTIGKSIFEGEKMRSNKLMENANNEINRFYKQVTVGDPVLETIGLVQVLHQDIFGPSKQKFDAIEMMNQIENMLHRMDKTITLIPVNRYRHYERKVNKRLTRERIEPLNARRKYKESKSYIKRMTGMYDKPPMGYRWRKVVPRSAVPPLRRRMKGTSCDRRGSEPKVNHLQLDKICARDDLEDEIDFVIKSHVRLKRKGTSDMDVCEGENSLPSTDLRSSVNSDTLMKFLGSEEGEEEMDTGSSFDILELVYDSDQMLIRENFKKRQEKGFVSEAPPDLYDVRSFDDRFLVKRGVDAESTAEKDRRHRHRPERKINFNPLSWR